MVPDVAVIVTFPGDTPVANPALLMVATDLSLELHTEELVIILVVLFENMAVAVNCCVLPAFIVGAAGVTVIDVRLTV
jgi:hypothetical protein